MDVLGAGSSFSHFGVAAENDRALDTVDDFASSHYAGQVLAPLSSESSIASSRRRLASLPVRLQQNEISSQRDSDQSQRSFQGLYMPNVGRSTNSRLSRLELPSNSLSSFKRSIEEATSPGNSILRSPVLHSSTPGYASTSSSTYTERPSTSSSSPPVLSPPTFRMEDSTSPISSASSASTSPEHALSFTYRMRLSIGRDAAVDVWNSEEESQGISTALLRHTPPTPSIATRIKRRRSGAIRDAEIDNNNTNHSATGILAWSNSARRANITSAPAIPERPASAAHIGTLSREDTRFLETPSPSSSNTNMPTRALTESSPLHGRWRPPPLSRSTPAVSEDVVERVNTSNSGSNLTRYIDSLLSSEQAQQARAHRSLLQMSHSDDSGRPTTSSRVEPTSQSSVHTRRGNDIDFDLGSLPRFNFAPTAWNDDDEVLISPTSYTILPHHRITPAFGSMAESAIPHATSMRTRLPRRPNLGRNTTAVTPPEESPLNTPDGDEYGAESPCTYAGMSFDSFSATSQTETFFELDDIEYEAELRESDMEDELDDGRLDHELDQDEEDLDYLVETRSGEAPSIRMERIRSLTPLELDLPSPILAEDDYGLSRSGILLDQFAEQSRNTSRRTTDSAVLDSNNASWNPVHEVRRAESLTDLIERRRNIASHVESLQSRPTNIAAPTAHQVQGNAVPVQSLDTRSNHHQNSVTVRNGSDRPPWLGPFDWQTTQTNDLDEDGPSTPASRNIAPISRDTTVASGLWGQFDTSHPLSRNLLSTPIGTTRPNLSSTATISAPASFNVVAGNDTVRARRPGSLGIGTMRGPTRSSNEAWLRNQGIDFYDNLGISTSVSHTEQRALAPIMLPTSIATSTVSATSRDFLDRNSSSAVRTLRRVAARQPLDLDAAITQPNLDRSVDNAITAADLLRRIDGTSARDTPRVSGDNAAVNQLSFPNHRNGQVFGQVEERRRTSPRLEALRPVSPLFNDEDMDQDIELYDSYVPEVRAGFRQNLHSEAGRHHLLPNPSSGILSSDELLNELEAGFANRTSMNSLYPHSRASFENQSNPPEEILPGLRGVEAFTDTMNNWSNHANDLAEMHQAWTQPNPPTSRVQLPPLAEISPHTNSLRLPPLPPANILSSVVSAPRVSIGHANAAVANAMPSGSHDSLETVRTRLHGIRRMLDQVCHWHVLVILY